MSENMNTPLPGEPENEVNPPISSEMENTNTPTPNEPEKGKGKWKRFLTGILIPLLMLSLFEGPCEEAFQKWKNIFSERRYTRELEQYMEQAREYVPGVVTEDGYSSEQLDLRFQAGDSWIMMEPDDEIAQEFLAEIKSSTAKELENEGISQQLIDKYLDTLQVHVEMETLYASDDDADFGMAFLFTLQGYGLDQESTDDLLKSFAEGASGPGVTTDTITIGKNKYSIASTSAEPHGVPFQAKIFCTANGGSLCLFCLYHMDGSENAYNSFLESLSSYN